MIKIYLLTMLLLPFRLLCQQRITGQVLSEMQKPLAGASVFVSNTTIGTLTDVDGKFTLTNLPAGNTRIAISFVGYKTTTATINPAGTSPYIITLAREVHELEGVVVNQFDPNGWENWGGTFTAAFIGTSAYAPECNITNKEVLNFYFSKSNNTLHAYALAPLYIENKALGYRITVTLVDFKYNIETKDVDYLVYSFFEEMKGKYSDVLKWEKNRAKVYKLSLMHFMRSLYTGTTATEGYEIRRLVKRRNIERQRVQALFMQRYRQVKDSLKGNDLKEAAVHKLLEKAFTRDSLKYYRNILEEDEGPERLNEKPIDDKLIISKNDSNLVTLHFKDYLVVTYKKSREPEEYNNYRLAVNESDNIERKLAVPIKIEWPTTILVLQQGIPLDISPNGYFANVDLFIDGFWGWWEKMATKLPYGYEP